ANWLERRESADATQALRGPNNGMVPHLAEQFAQRVSGEAAADPARRLERLYWIALSRPPSAEETAVGVAALNQLTDEWAQHLGKSDPDAARHKALTTFCHALMNSAGFLYVD